ncbi:hypothetical protein KP79_PYT22776 [Mizuhopecten yessoensis]|uniref:Cubilin n=2 Tax=Mizuhopecten yessoensis TaxID=6573 RepID=A0A210QPJ5_MIZYE|nr:hypothetical protein KP79_PYT22776 [Mizuhopecten yessoensis]
MDDLDFRDESCTNSYIRLSDTKEEYNNMCYASSTQFLSKGNWTKLTLHTGSDRTGRGFRITVRSIVPVPENLSNVKVVAVKRVIKVSWEPPTDYNTDHITAYRVRYSVLASTNTLAVTLPASRRSFVINTRGHEGQLYVVKVSVMHKFQEGATSSPSYVRAACSTHIVLGPNERINITSPGYPGNYSPLVLCNWRIISGSGGPFYFRTIAMDVAESLFCNSDYVSLSGRDNNRRCGEISTPEQFTRVSGELNVTFVTDDLHQAKGFIIEVKSEIETTLSQQTITSTNTTKITDVSSSSLTKSSVNTTDPTGETYFSEQYLTTPVTAYNVRSSSYLSTIVHLKGDISSFVPTTNTDTQSSTSLYLSSATVISSEMSSVSYESSSVSSINEPLSSYSTTTFVATITEETQLRASLSSSNRDVPDTTENIFTNLVVKSSLGTDLPSSTSPSTIQTTDAKTSVVFNDTYTTSSVQDLKSHSFPETLPSLQPTSVSVCNVTTKNSNYNVTYDVCIKMLLHSREQSTKRGNGKQRLEQSLHAKLTGIFNTTMLFTGITMSKFGTLKPGNSLVPVSVVVSFNLCGLVSAKICEPSFRLVKHINDTSLDQLTSHPAITDRWEVDPVYLKMFRSTAIFENQEIDYVCVPPLRQVCGDYSPCEDSMTISTGSLEQSRGAKMSFPTSLVVAVVGILFVLVSSCAVMLRYRKYKIDGRKIHATPIQVHDIISQDQDARRGNINFHRFSHYFPNKSPFLRTGSFPSKTTLQRSEIEDDIKCDVNKLAWFIEDIVTLEKRLRRKRNVRRSNSF